MVKIFSILAATLLLSGCFGVTLPIVNSEVSDITYIHPAAPAELVLREVNWRVLNREEMIKYLEENKDAEIALFALHTKDYENLALNMQEIIRYLREQKEIIIYYRETLPAPEEKTSE